MEQKRLSVVLPAYNEEQNIVNTARVLADYLKQQKIDYELIFVNDGSTDGTFEQIEKATNLDSNVKGISFSRNFGKESAIFAGLEVTNGDAIVVMDCDLQHPVDKIREMWNLWLEGAEIVEGVKLSRGKESIFHKLSAGMFYNLMSKMIKIDMRASSDFKLLDRKVVDLLLSLQERNTFFRALTFWVGFDRKIVHYEVQDRQYGESKWSVGSLVKYAVTNVTSFSTLPLKFVAVMGGIMILLSIGLGIQTLVRFFMGNAVEGFTTVILLILIVGGFIMLSLGIIGHYIGRIYEEVKRRPKYIINKATENISVRTLGMWK